jgi:hypothetical protein
MVSGKIFIQILPSDSKKLVGISHYGHFRNACTGRCFQSVFSASQTNMGSLFYSHCGHDGGK